VITLTPATHGTRRKAGPFDLAQADPIQTQADDCTAWRPPKGWPENARQMTTALTRQAPTLRQLGWLVDRLDRDNDRSKVIHWKLKPPDDTNATPPCEKS